MNIKILLTILRIIEKSKKANIKEIRKESDIDTRIFDSLLLLEELGFIRKVINEPIDSPISEVAWKITKEGKKFLKYFDLIFSEEDKVKEVYLPKVNFLVTVPAHEKLNELKSYEKMQIVTILEDLFSKAKEEILISSPFIDTLIISLINNVENKDAKIHIFTNELQRDLRNALIRLKEKYPNLTFNCIKEVRNGVQIYQLHSKTICIDTKYVLITSANINERSLYHNIETGILIEDKEIASMVREFLLKLTQISNACI